MLITKSRLQGSSVVIKLSSDNGKNLQKIKNTSLPILKMEQLH